ncbi:TIGR02646 family protein [Vibrio breoganii]|uniref:retron system putative HNH endonuclease n=1 Tax=Vibrio breoganii TaxID=553239 RepID=UPI000C84D130|nr:retron system putative HNH endonuclease [Vibrio breoganii]PMM79335.1 TIGR02646 family protein [Vibrio breoganii]TKF84846.1 TIGR02646 family protein [Vibrio breoganii]
MRYIAKSNPDRHLIAKNNKKPRTASDATKAWGRFRFKSSTSDKCFDEQFGLCCYSEISIDNRVPILDSHQNELSRDLGRHIEHVEPKSKNPSKTFDHNNLLLSAISDVKANNLSTEDVFGGHAKQGYYSSSWFISPLNQNVKEYFHYETSGRVVPKESLPSRRERAKARLTIHILNLNAPILVQWRRTWLVELTNMIDSYDIDQVKLLAEVELMPYGSRLRPFHSAQRQVFGSIGEKVILDSGITL